jgi:hypothetical protein
MMKKVLGLTFIFLIVGVLAYLLWPNSKKAQSWHTYNKEDTSTIKSYPTTKNEKKAAHLDHENEKKGTRKPASIKKTIDKKSSASNRTWTLKPGQKLPKKITFLNEPKKEWRDLLGQDLMRFLRPQTKIYVKNQGSHTLLKRDGGLHVEKVHIKMQSPEGRQYSYHAYVDSETGKVVRTWNQTIHEPMGKKTQKLKPSGHISPDGVIRY